MNMRLDRKRRSVNFKFFSCPNPECRLHIVLINEDGEVIGDMPMNEMNCEYMIDVLERNLAGLPIDWDGTFGVSQTQ